METNDKYKELIIRKLSDFITPTEQEDLNCWIEKNTKNKKIYHAYEKTWQLAQKNTSLEKEIQAIDLQKEWAVQQQKSNRLEHQKTKLIVNSSHSFTKYFVAASLILTLGFLSFWLMKSKQTTLVAHNKITTTKLPDGSVATLYRNSKISFTGNFDSKFRTINLQGEAFFEVKHNAQKPFLVNTGMLTAEDLGTKFTVSSRNRGVVEVLEGSVKVYAKGILDTLVLQAGEKGVINKSNKLVKLLLNNSNCFAWKTKIFEYNNAKLSDVIKDLAKSYDFIFKISSKKVNESYLTVTFRNEKPEIILLVLKKQFPAILFEVSGKVVTISDKQNIK